MKKHKVEASYKFLCLICCEMFEKKDSVTAHKTQGHRKILTAETLVSNGGPVINPFPESERKSTNQPQEKVGLSLHHSKINILLLT